LQPATNHNTTMNNNTSTLTKLTSLSRKVLSVCACLSVCSAFYIQFFYPIVATVFSNTIEFLWIISTPIAVYAGIAFIVLKIITCLR